MPHRDLLCGLGDRRQPGQAQLVDGSRRHIQRDAAGGRTQPGRVGADSRLHHVAHDDGADLDPGNPGALQGGGDRRACQRWCRQGGQGAEQLADRGTGPGDKYGLWHGCLLYLSSGFLARTGIKLATGWGQGETWRSGG